MYKSIIILSLACLVYACKDGGSLTTATVKSAPNAGFNYKHIVDTGGKQANVGDYVFFTMDIYDDRDSVLQKNTEQLNYPSVQVLEPTDPNRASNPMLDIISVLAVGDSAAILVPIDSIPGGLPPNMSHVKTLEYHVSVKDILTKEENDAKMAAAKAEAAAKVSEVETLTAETLAKYQAGSLDVKTTPGGVKYYIHETGIGDLPTPGQRATWSYYGRTVSTGERFDDSFSRGRGYGFRIGQDAVIQGWHEAGPFLSLGTRASIFIPSELGYGAQGSGAAIPPNSELYFYIVVDEILN